MKVLVTGGAGFIGCNLTRALASLGHRVMVVDNLSRSGSERNLRALVEQGSAAELVTFRSVDVRDSASMAAILVEPGDPYDAVVHLAGQTTVTESVTDPLYAASAWTAPQPATSCLSTPTASRSRSRCGI